MRDPDVGEIRANDCGIADFSLTSWYDEIALVPQETRLIPGTVADNIKFYRAASEEDVERAARLAHIHDDIASWPEKYETSVGEHATQMSGGQGQRLCIAARSAPRSEHRYPRRADECTRCALGAADPQDVG